MFHLQKGAGASPPHLNTPLEVMKDGEETWLTGMISASVRGQQADTKTYRCPSLTTTVAVYCVRSASCSNVLLSDALYAVTCIAYVRDCMRMWTVRVCVFYYVFFRLFVMLLLKIFR